MQTNNKCLDWNPCEHFEGFIPKILLIGHDPRLQTSDTIADYALFINYYFNECPNKGSEKRKYNFAKASLEQVLNLTNNKYRAEEIYVTNLCNEALPHAPQGKTVLISHDIAKAGVERIKNIISHNNSIDLIFPMSQQVNYWLQRFGFYCTDTEFLLKAEPKEKGIINESPYYEPKKQKAFLDICGNIYKTEASKKVIPILHTKQYNKITTYFPKYEKLKEMLAEL
jgi:hypothetical protein